MQSQFCFLFSSSSKNNLIKVYVFILLKKYKLSNKFIRNWSQQEWCFLSIHNMCRPRLCWLSLQLHENALLFGLLTQFLILLHTCQEILSALGVINMFNADIDSLGDDFSTYSLVDDNSKSVCSDVEYSSRFSVVSFVWHTLLDSTVAFDVYDITYFVCFHVGGQGDDSMSPEFTGEQIPRTATVTLWVRHVLRLRKEHIPVSHMLF